MKYPLSFRILGVFNLLIGLVAALVAIIVFSAQWKASDPGYNVSLVIAFSSGVFFWTLFASSSWFFSSKSGYVITLLNIAVFAAPGIFFIFTMKNVVQSHKGNDMGVAIIFLFALTVFLFFNIVIALVHYKTYMRADFLKLPQTLIPGFFFLFALLPGLTVLFLQTFVTRDSYVYIYNVNSTASMTGFGNTHLTDGNPETWWTPANHHGVNSSITFDFSEQEIVGIEIWPGSHNPNYPGYGDLFKKNSRLKSADIQFSDGTTQTIQLADVDRAQRISVKPVKAHSMVVIVRSTIPGEKWNDLCISEMRPLTRKKYFRK